MAAYRDKKKKGIWRWRRMVTNPFTKERRRLGGTPAVDTKAAADEAERAAVMDFILDPAKRPNVRARGLTVKEAAARFLAHMESRVVERADEDEDLAPSTVIKLEGHIRNHLVADLGDLPLAQVTDEILVEWLDKLRQKPQGLRGHALKRARRAAAAGKPLPEAPRPRIKARTVRDVLRIAHGMFVWAASKKLVDAVPRFPKPPKPIKRPPAYLTLDETHALLAVSSPEDRLLLLVAVKSGLRQGEQMALRWGDIDFQGNKINVRWAYKKARNGREIEGKPKGKKERVVDVDPALIAALRAARNLNKLVFSDAAGEHLGRKHFHRVLKKGKAAAGITKPFTWHDLRHTFGSHMANASIDLQTVQHWMGHESIKTTQMYAHFMPERGQAQVDKFVKWQAGEKP